MKLYYEETTQNLFNSKRQQIKDKINSESEDYILNVGESQYIKHLQSQFFLDCPEIHVDQVTIDSYEGEIQGHQFPMEFMITNKNNFFKKTIIVYHIPYSGSISLLRYRPNRFNTSIGTDIQTDHHTNTIKLEFINFYNDPQRIKLAYEEQLRYIFGCYDSLKAEIEEFNNNLESFITATFNERKQHFLAKSNFLNSLGVPIKKSSNISTTFSVPKPVLRKKINIKPQVTEKGYKPEPTLSNDDYFEILKIINDIGKNFERLPATYSNKGEEALRDHILMILDPNFELGSAGGETFNKSGKTDILLRYDSSVVFVGECKFWSGEKKFLETIDQLLGYLTWRDSKTSVIIFVQNKDMTSVIESVSKASKKHYCFIKELTKSDDSWFNYIFSLPNDKNKEIKLAVQIFHIPSM